MKLEHVAVRGAGLTVHAWASGAGLAAVYIGAVPPSATARGRVPVKGVEIATPGEELRALAEALGAFLAGRPLRWAGELDLRGVTDFQREVFVAVREIPFAEIRTYGQVARAIGRPEAVRAVGNALRRNPFPLVVPCHRVLREGGGLGGFACGVDAKRRLLSIESGQTELPLDGARE